MPKKQPKQTENPTDELVDLLTGNWEGIERRMDQAFEQEQAFRKHVRRRRKDKQEVFSFYFTLTLAAGLFLAWVAMKLPLLVLDKPCAAPASKARFR